MVRRYKILLVILIFFPYDLYPQATKDNYSSSSILSSGQWFKLAVLKDGIYRINYSSLKEMGLQNPARPRIYANNSGQLSYYNDDPATDDLKEISIYTSTGADGIFNEGDYILFFGQSTGRWKFDPSSAKYSYLRHNYSDTAFYFLTSSAVQGKEITSVDEPVAVANYSSSESDALFIHEIDKENLIKSGREWFQPVSSLSGITVDPGFTDLLTTVKLNFRIRVLGRAPVNTLFRFYEGTEILKELQVQSVNMFNYTGTYAQITDSTGSVYPLSSSPVFDIKFYNNGESGAKGWLDFVTLHGKKRNIFTGETNFLSDAGSIAPARTTEFTVKSPADSPVIWDITDASDPKIISYAKIGEDIRFKAPTETLRSFVLFLEKNTIEPIFRSEPVQNQDLHAAGPADMAIITHPMFIKYAEKLADIHYRNSGLISQVVTIEEIYNEFSGGIPDAVAIRNFARMKYLRQSGTHQPFKYLLLFGDGSYENKTLPPGNPNFIPTYQSENSNVVVSSFTSDDFYGLLEDGEGEAEGTEDIGIGRLPVSDTSQAGIIIRKIARYIDPHNTGEWKNMICITADDEDGNTHMYDAEELSKILQNDVPAFRINKIYLDAYRQFTSINGQSYPEVTTAINDQINSGALIFNYVGHGNENGLAHERVVTTENINSWKNGPRLPLFITATCEFSRFDDIDINILTGNMTGKTSAGEMVLLNEAGGGIALMTTTRVVYSAPNFFLNRNIYDFAFDVDADGNPLRLGDIMRLAKNNSGSGTNKRNFSLLGDPAVRLAFPRHGRVITDSINQVAVTNVTDSLKALSRITVSGHIEDPGGNIISDYNGLVSPVVFDKSSKIKTLANDGGQIFNFEMRNNILFNGKTAAADGRFRFTFIVPRDIDYSYGEGKINYYTFEEGLDMNGSYSGIIVGGFAEAISEDTKGPDIKLYLNDTLFRDGGITDQNPKMLAIIQDENGINTTGAGIGHDIIAYLDNNPNTSFVLNNYFENDFDNYMKGKVMYELSDLSEGNHSLTIKAWDNYNNSSLASVHFIVHEGGKFILRNLMNYPNPVVNETKISAEHNRPDKELDVTVRIYDLNGRIIRIINTSCFSYGYRLSPVIWDGKSREGDRVGKGMYPYRVTVTTADGEKAEGSGRIIIL